MRTTYPDEAAHVPTGWPQIAVLLGGLAGVLALLLAQTFLNPRPKVILPQNVAGLREVGHLETDPHYFLDRIVIGPDHDVLLATNSYANYLWRLGDGTQQVMNLENSGGYTTSLFFAGRTPVALFASWAGSIRWLNLSTGQTVHRLDAFGSLQAFNWGISAKGEALAITTDQTLTVFDVPTARPRYTITAEPGRAFWYGIPTFNDQGDRVAVGYRDWSCDACDSDVVIWDAFTGAQSAWLGKFPQGSLWAFDFSDDDTLLAVGGAVKSQKEHYTLFQLWDLQTGTELALRRRPGLSIQQILISPDNRLIAAYGYGDVWLWDVESLIGTGIPLIERFGDGNARYYSGIAFSPDSQLFALGTPDTTIQLFEAHSGRLLAELVGHQGPGHITDLHFSADGQLLVSSGTDNTVRVWAVGGPNFDEPVRLEAAALPAPVMTPTLPG